MYWMLQFRGASEGSLDFSWLQIDILSEPSSYCFFNEWNSVPNEENASKSRIDSTVYKQWISMVKTLQTQEII